MCALVTGVQTCALPILSIDTEPVCRRMGRASISPPIVPAGRRSIRFRRAVVPCRESASRARTTRIDRKGVVSGKSVSVRVDLGGRRNNQNKKPRHIHQHEQKPTSKKTQRSYKVI